MTALVPLISVHSCLIMSSKSIWCSLFISMWKEEMPIMTLDSYTDLHLFSSVSSSLNHLEVRWKHHNLNSYRYLWFTCSHPSFYFLCLRGRRGSRLSEEAQTSFSGVRRSQARLDAPSLQHCSGSALGLLPGGPAQNISKGKCARDFTCSSQQILYISLPRACHQGLGTYPWLD